MFCIHHLQETTRLRQSQIQRVYISVIGVLFKLYIVCLSISAGSAVLPKSLGTPTEGSVETPAMNPTPTVGRPPGQRGRKPGRRKTKITGPWSQKPSTLVSQSIQPGKDLEPIKIPKKRGPKPGSKVGKSRAVHGSASVLEQ